MQKFELVDAKGYVVFKHGDDCILVDTGSPMTFAKPGTSVDICGEHCVAASGFMAQLALASLKLDLGEVAKHVGCNVTMLLGADSLQKFNVLIDMPNGEIAFSKNEIPFEGSVQNLENLMGYTLVNVELNGKNRRVFLDTGAPISYVNQDSLANCERIGERDDYSPTYGGHLHTVLYRASVTFAGKHIPLECGLSPTSLNAQVSMIGAEGVIGGAIFAEHKVLLDFANSVAKIA